MEKHGCVCVCVLEMEEGMEGIKTLVWMFFSDCQRVAIPWPLTHERSRQSRRHCSLAIARTGAGTACVCEIAVHQVMYCASAPSLHRESTDSLIFKHRICQPKWSREHPSSPPFQPWALSRSSYTKEGASSPLPHPFNKRAICDSARSLSCSVKLTKCVQRRSSAAAATQTLQEGREAAGDRTLITTLPPFWDKQAATPSLKSSCKHTHPPAMNISANATKFWASTWLVLNLKSSHDSC